MKDNKLFFAGSIDKVIVDREGYSKVTLEIPSLFLPVVTSLMSMTGQALDFQVKQSEGSNGI